MDRGARSPLLVAAPADRGEQLRRRRGRRSLVLAIAVALVLVLGLPLLGRLLVLPRLSLVLCRLHDQVLLPLYSLAVIRFSPWSSSWLLTGCGLVLVSLAGWLLARSPWRRLHIAALRLALRFDRSQQLLLRWCFRRRRRSPSLGTGMIHTVLAFDQQTAVQDLVAAPPGTAAAVAGRAVSLSLLQARLAEATAGPGLARVNGLCEVLVPLLLSGAGASSPALSALLAELQLLLGDEPLAAEGHCFSAPVLLRDLQLVLGFLQRTASTAMPAELHPVLAGLAERRRLVDGMRRQLEQGLLGDSAALPRASVGIGAMPWQGIPGPADAAAARLAITLSQLVALTWNDPALAGAYLDSLDALWFVLLAVGPAGNELVTLGEQLCLALPDPADYRLVARLLERRLAATRAQLAEAGASSLVTPADLELEAQRISRLQTAAADPGQGS